MSLRIKTSKVELTWNFGATVSLLGLMSLVEIEWIEARDKELEYIDANFSGIPMPYDRESVKWYGDTARFIVGNFMTIRLTDLKNEQEAVANLRPRTRASNKAEKGEDK